MATPVRYPYGVNLFNKDHVLKTFPVFPSPQGQIKYEGFWPYLAANYTVTQTNGTATTTGYEGGMVKLATTGGGAGDLVALTGLGSGFQFLQNQRSWFNCRLAYVQANVAAGNANDTALACGLGDSTTVTGSSNAVYFAKPAGQTAVNFVIKKGGTSTIFQNIGDLALPSGIYGDANSSIGTLNATIAGNAYTVISVASPGAGYHVNPLLLTTPTAGGTLNTILASCGIGGASSSLGVNSNQTFPGSLPYGSLYSPQIFTGGSGFTNSASATNLLEVEHWADYSFFMDRKGVIHVGVNGREVLSIGPGGNIAVAAGATVNAATQASPSFASSTQLSSSLCPVQPAAGSAFNLLPLVTLNPSVGFGNTTANPRVLYVKELTAGVEVL